MNMEYRENLKHGFRWIGEVNYEDLRQFAQDLDGEEITVKSVHGTIVYKAVHERLRAWQYRWVYYIGDFRTEKFSYLAKIVAKWKDHLISIKFGDDLEVVELDNGDLHVYDDDVCKTYDTEVYLLKADCYYCETDGKWYEDTDELCEIDGEWYRTDDEDVFYCEKCDEYHCGESYEVHVNRHGDTECWCEGCAMDNSFICDDCGERWSDDYHNGVDRPYRDVCDDCYEADYCYCEHCDRRVHYDYWDSDNDCCIDCSETDEGVKSYHWHHNHSYVNDNKLFMPKGKMVSLGSSNEVKTCGLELEVSKSTCEGQSETLDDLTSIAGLEENEIFFEHDGSLDSGGFEIITGVHTFDSLKQMPWRAILDVLKEHGYRSHDGGLCGLHVHVGRNFFGKSRNAQDIAIGKIYAFYGIFWKDLVRASRRERLTYCDHPYDEVDKDALVERIEKNPSAARKAFQNKAYRKDGSHGLALNNSNSATFEFRLGRGTLIYESFMAWIDFTLTVVKNSKTISTRKVKDMDSWLKGISKETAIYLKSRRAFEDSEVIRNLTEGVNVCA